MKMITNNLSAKDKLRGPRASSVPSQFSFVNLQFLVSTPGMENYPAVFLLWEAGDPLAPFSLQMLVLCDPP